MRRSTKERRMLRATSKPKQDSVWKNSKYTTSTKGNLRRDKFFVKHGAERARKVCVQKIFGTVEELQAYKDSLKK